ncbi:glycosyltransferase family 4 protein [Candidatus Sulfidibacterium hydrothermale]|uniref:glycosyltransferase family 4 protein n=1 Tax=Candidatus Sulfidibacterium hydrothermale TaxID=2875962 RepID=UPI001F0AA4C9|nr:glycosyltransferase family 4 protein [Candidatus Sulfidibacterium hydrothermale]UBM62455.1 glycosyltransferase family 4 protein [Candidatus Sulfidibacterium hydrothermale]
MKVIINTRDLVYRGGVVNFYKVLNLNSYDFIDYFYYSKPKKKKIFFLFKKYFEFFIKIKSYDIVHLNPSLTKTAIWRDLLFLLIAKLKKKKVVVFIHGWDYNLENIIINSRLYKNIFSIYNNVDAFFISGTIFKTKLTRMGIDKNKLFFLETMIADDKYINDFSLEERIRNFSESSRMIRFLFLSRITKGKGMQLAIDIFNIIQTKYNRKMELVIAGDGDKLEETKEYVKQKNINNVIFKGYIMDEEKHNVLKLCDITLFPTMYGEGIPNTILEGMLYGMPIISRINAGIPDWVKNGENGFIISSINPNDFVPFIESLLNNPKLYEKISRNNHELAKKTFTKDVISKRFLKHYQEVFDAQ